MRPRVLLHGRTPVPLRILEDVTFSVSCVDSDGVPSEKVVRDFKLEAAGETTYTFPVPANLSQIRVRTAGLVFVMNIVCGG
jgi:hypothetical protein